MKTSLARLLLAALLLSLIAGATFAEDPANPSTPPGSASFSGGLTAAGPDWTALCPLLEMSRDTRDASWKWDGQIAEFAAGKPRAAVSFPLSIEGSYELQARVTIVRAKETTAIYLPIAGGKAVVLDLRGNSGNSESPTVAIRLKGLNPTAELQGDVSIKIGTEYAFECKVTQLEEKVDLEIRCDDQVLFQWSGAVSQVVGKPLMRAGTVELETAYYTVSRFSELRLRMLSR